jgi:branched-chain amino acid transport system ATP-binding protein
MAAPLLETRDLNLRFGGVHAVRNVNFTLAEGELRCLIGPNGAGKSTFFKMLTGQLQPSQGHVLFRGYDISNAHAHEIARMGIGIKTQVPNVFDGLSVRENIWLAASRIHSSARADEAVDEMLERIGLTAAAERLVGQLAHGHRQWVELGIVLSTDPELILLDEPAAGVNPTLLNELLSAVRKLRDAGKTIFLVEHDMKVVMGLCEAVFVLDHGEMLAQGLPGVIQADERVVEAYFGR